MIGFCAVMSRNSMLMVRDGAAWVLMSDAPTTQNNAACMPKDQNNGVLKRLSDDIVEWLGLM
jgi:hypothetical protein